MNKPVYLLLFLALVIPVPAQTRETLLFQIANSSHDGLEYSSTIFYFYQNGRIDCQTEARTERNIAVPLTKGEKFECHQLQLRKITELTELAGQADFQKADRIYRFFKGGRDWGRSLTVTYFGKDGQKTIRLDYSDDVLNKNRVPPSLKKFLSRIGEIDKQVYS